MTVEQYFQAIQEKFNAGLATEHTYRTYLQQLIESLEPDITVTNEPKRVKVGAPDYILTKKQIPIGYIEAKDIVSGILDKKDTQNQVKKYFGGGLGNNFILTDYLEFRFYQSDELVNTISIAKPEGKNLTVFRDSFDSLKNALKNFCLSYGQTIKSSKRLAELMAAKARMIKEVIVKALADEEDQGGELKGQLEAFRNILIHDMTEESFADVYAQTITYGLFAARLHDPTLEDFSRMEAASLLPKTNPFLRQLFGYIGAINLDTRLVWIVDDLVEVFKAANVAELLADYGKVSQRNDPIVHFYEDFLAAYDKKLRKARGVWYTPEPVVDFIVRAVDEILQTEFGLSDGLADTSKTTIKVQTQTRDNRFEGGYKTVDREVHRVQVLDPATGTGTFLARVIQEIYSKMGNMPALWKSYVNKDLIPRIHGFELLMASYAMAHLKLDMILRETGAEPNQRLSVYLTNSLEEAHPDTGTLFAQWLAQESSEANKIKKQTPIMCIIGNPPYSVSSSNKGNWILNLLTDYKKNLNERKINLDDDYIKFIRYAHYYIEKNKVGILAYISNNSYIDGITHRQMRRKLLGTFDKIYVLDLHGNAKKKEVSPDGSPDQNVFDIMQGVSINIFIKNGNKKSNELGKVFHSEIFGKRQKKYSFLSNHNYSELKWEELINKDPYYFFVPKDFEAEEDYQQGFKIDELFKVNNSGVSTDRDLLFLDYDSSKLESRIKILLEGNFNHSFQQEFNVKDSSGYPLMKRISGKSYDSVFIQDYHYRPFDFRKIYFDKSIISRPAKAVTNHANKENFFLIVPRQVNKEFHHIFISRIICDSNITSSARLFGAGKLFPLYLFEDSEGQLTIEEVDRKKPNLDKEIVQIISQKLSLSYSYKKEDFKDYFTPINILDYIYAVLHSPSYRNVYKEFLKINFPRVPYPEDQKTFWQLVKLGSKLRKLHLLESSVLSKQNIRLDGGENLEVDKIGKSSYDPKTERVYINKEVYFEGVSPIAWDFYIGGYQPAQKWLKDRKGRTLSFEDVKHYMKIIVALTETDRIMKEIDKVDFF